LVDEANATLGKLGSVGASVSHHEALVMLLSGRPEVAEARLREGVRAHDSMGDARSLATTTAMLAQAVYALGRADEAAELCRTTADAAAADDIVTQVIWRGVQAKVLARAGRCEEALALAREAVGLVSPTDLLSHHGDAMLDLADVLQTCSYAAEAEDAVRSAYALYAAKGNAASSARARSLLSA
jgi:ATP/maltotriose-dependent transcriptional regulator MalT